MPQDAPPELISPTPPFSAGHAAVILVAALLTVAWIRLGIASKSNGSERSVRVGSAMAALCAQIAYTVSEMLPMNFDPTMSLPLHVCDMGAYLAGLMILLPRVRWLQVIVFFWGFALTTQAFLTPTVKDPLTAPAFWFYWLQHWSIVAAALWAWFVAGYRPSKGDFLFMLAVDLGLLIVIVPINIGLGANYMWLGNTERDVRTLLDFLGPWPARIGVVFVLAHAIMLAVWLIATTADRRRDPSPQAESGG